jgi:hypothetical protein
MESAILKKPLLNSMDAQLMNEQRYIESLPIVSNENDVIYHPLTGFFIGVLLYKSNKSITNHSKRLSSADIFICDGG